MTTNFGSWDSNSPARNGVAAIKRGVFDGEMALPPAGVSITDGGVDYMGVFAPSVPYRRMWKVEANFIVRPVSGTWQGVDFRLQLYNFAGSAGAVDARGIATHQTRIAVDSASYTGYQTGHLTGEYWLLENTGYSCYLQSGSANGSAVRIWTGGEYLNILGLMSGEGFS